MLVKKLLVVLLVTFIVVLVAVPAFAQEAEDLIPCVNMTPDQFSELVAIPPSPEVSVNLPNGNCDIGLVIYDYSDFTISVPFWNRTQDQMLIGIPISQEWGQSLMVLDWALWHDRGFLLLEDSWGWLYEVNIGYGGYTNLNVYLPDDTGRIFDHDSNS